MTTAQQQRLRSFLDDKAFQSMLRTFNELLNQIDNMIGKMAEEDGIITADTQEIVDVEF